MYPNLDYILRNDIIPLRAKRVREAANLTERKNLHSPVNGVKEFVYLSVTNFDLNYLRSGEIVHLYLILIVYSELNDTRQDDHCTSMHYLLLQ